MARDSKAEARACEDEHVASHRHPEGACTQWNAVSEVTQRNVADTPS